MFFLILKRNFIKAKCESKISALGIQRGQVESRSRLTASWVKLSFQPGEAPRHRAPRKNPVARSRTHLGNGMEVALEAGPFFGLQASSRRVPCFSGDCSWFLGLTFKPLKG